MAEKYVYVNPSGATLTWSKKPAGWDSFVGQKKVVDGGPSGGGPPGTQPAGSGEIQKTYYVYKNPAGAVHFFSQKPHNWNQLVGQKAEYSATLPSGVSQTEEQLVKAAIRQELQGKGKAGDILKERVRQLNKQIGFRKGVPVKQQLESLSQEELEIAAQQGGVAGYQAKKLLQQKKRFVVPSKEDKVTFPLAEGLVLTQRVAPQETVSGLGEPSFLQEGKQLPVIKAQPSFLQQEMIRLKSEEAVTKQSRIIGPEGWEVSKALEYHTGPMIESSLKTLGEYTGGISPQNLKTAAYIGEAAITTFPGLFFETGQSIYKTVTEPETTRRAFVQSLQTTEGQVKFATSAALSTALLTRLEVPRIFKRGTAAEYEFGLNIEQATKGPVTVAKADILIAAEQKVKTGEAALVVAEKQLGSQRIFAGRLGGVIEKTPFLKEIVIKPEGKLFKVAARGLEFEGTEPTARIFTTGAAKIEKSFPGRFAEASKVTIEPLKGKTKNLISGQKGGELIRITQGPAEFRQIIGKVFVMETKLETPAARLQPIKDVISPAVKGKTLPLKTETGLTQAIDTGIKQVVSEYVSKAKPGKAPSGRVILPPISAIRGSFKTAEPLISEYEFKTKPGVLPAYKIDLLSSQRIATSQITGQFSRATQERRSVTASLAKINLLSGQESGLRSSQIYGDITGKAVREGLLTGLVTTQRTGTTFKTPKILLPLEPKFPKQPPTPFFLPADILGEELRGEKKKRKSTFYYIENPLPKLKSLI